MYCRVNNIDSELRPVKCGVPQGTCLGPLLFLCYTYDITKVTNYLIFADDTSIGIEGDNESITAYKLESILQSFNKWVRNNKLELNWTKSKIIP